jgi:hypothetical protein
LAQSKETRRNEEKNGNRFHMAFLIGLLLLASVLYTLGGLIGLWIVGGPARTFVKIILWLSIAFGVLMALL